MKRRHLKNLVVLVSLNVLFFSGLAGACDRSSPELSVHGEIVYPISDNNGKRMGLVRQQHDGWWEAVLASEGALNERFSTADRAGMAVCREVTVGGSDQNEGEVLEKSHDSWLGYTDSNSTAVTASPKTQATHLGLTTPSPLSWDGSERYQIYIGTDQQIYHDDLWLNTTTRLTQTASGQPGNGPSTQLLVAGDWVIYHTQATNLGPEGAGLYRQHLYNGQRELIGRDRWGQPDPQASHPAATADGELIAYQRPDEYDRQHIYLTDTLSIERISLHADASLGLLDHCCVALSANGQFIVYQEQGSQGLAWLHILDRDTEHFTRIPWPEELEHAPQFREDDAQLWWINPAQGSGQPEVLHRVDNPLR